MAEQSLTDSEKEPVIAHYQPKHNEVVEACSKICELYPDSFRWYD